MGSPLPPDPYIALGVSKDATPAAIKGAHRKLVLKCHPDKVSDPAAKQAASDVFHKIQSAYEILIDEDRRGRYDAQVRLAELKREALERRGSGEGSRGRYDSRAAYTSQRSSRESTFRDDYYSRGHEGMTPQFEERRPDFAQTPSSSVPKPTAKPTAAPTPAPAPAATAATATAEFDNAPSKATARKDPEERSSRRSGNEPREKPKVYTRDSSRERARARDERKQRLQREMRRDRDQKYEERKPGSYAEDESGSNSDEYSRRQRRSREERSREERSREERPREDRPREERPREERPREDRPREERPREERQPDDPATLDRARQEYYVKAQRQEKEAATDANLDPLTKKMFTQHSKAWDYIHKSRHRSHADSERRPSPTRGNSSKEKVEYAMRSDGRGQQVPVMMRRSSTRPKDERERDVEPPRRRTTKETDRRSPERDGARRPPPFSKSTSTPSDIRVPQSEKSRAQSWDDAGVPSSGKPPVPGGIQRAETFNSYGSSRRGESGIPSNSHFRPTDFSDANSRSPGVGSTYEVSPTSREHYYNFLQYPEKGEYPMTDVYRAPSESVRVETREPEARGRHRAPQFTRQVTNSPDGMASVRESRPPIDSRFSSSGNRVYSVNPSSGMVEQLDLSRPNSGRSSRDTQSSRHLYGEIPPPRYSGTDAYENVSYAQPVRPENAKTSKYKVSEPRSYRTVPVR